MPSHAPTRHRPTRSQLLAAGRWLLESHFASFDIQPTSEQIDTMLANHNLLREVVRQAFSDVPTAVFAPLLGGNPEPRTREMLAILDEALCGLPLTGLSIAEALALLAEHGIETKGTNLTSLIRASYPQHRIHYLRGYIRFRSDVTVALLNRNLRAEKLARKDFIKQIHSKPRAPRATELAARETIQLHSRRVA